MKLSPRHGPVQKARLEMAEFLAGLKEKYGLTDAEQLAVMTEWLDRQMWLYVKHERRGEHEGQ